VVQAGPCVVVQKKTVDKDGYESVQLGLVEFIKPKRVTKGMTGHFKKAGTAPVRILREMKVEGEDSPKAGDKVLCDIFTAEERVHVIGTSKGRGFAGLIKRHHFRRASQPRVDVPPGARFDRRVSISFPRDQGHANGRSSG
jgi:large subunit ribosomal protein L3